MGSYRDIGPYLNKGYIMLRKIEFDTYSHPFYLEGTKNVEIVYQMFIVVFKEAMLIAMAKGILPRGVELRCIIEGEEGEPSKGFELEVERKQDDGIQQRGISAPAINEFLESFKTGFNSTIVEMRLPEKIKLKGMLDIYGSMIPPLVHKSI